MESDINSDPRKIYVDGEVSQYLLNLFCVERENRDAQNIQNKHYDSRM